MIDVCSTRHSFPCALQLSCSVITSHYWNANYHATTSHQNANNYYAQFPNGIQIIALDLQYLESSNGLLVPSNNFV